jgi:3'(2'), 5'-bisphosphate nucleotidase
LHELPQLIHSKWGDEMGYERERQVAIAALTAAAQLCQRVRAEKEWSTLSKADCSPVTVADFGAQAIICQMIATAFPMDAIVAEEDAALLAQPDQAQQLQRVTDQVRWVMPAATPAAVLTWIKQGTATVGDRFWTLDPIDGTKGFLRGDHYAIALALIEAGEVKMGLLACPALAVAGVSAIGTLFIAVRGQGTMMRPLCNPSMVEHPVTAIMQRQQRLAESVEGGHGNPSLQRRIAAMVGLKLPSLQMDSQAKYGALACGQAILYLRLPWTAQPDYQENIWDHAAGAIVVEEAGGQVTDMNGQPLDFTQGSKLVANRGIVASCGVIHTAVLRAVANCAQESGETS